MTIYKPDILVSVNPTLFCKNNCSYCYLGSLRNDTTTIQEDMLAECLSKISSKYRITHIDIYGGDLQTLSDDSLAMVLCVCEKFCKDNITVISDPFDRLIKLKQCHKFNIATSVNDERPYSANVEASDILIYTVLPSLVGIDAKAFLDQQKKPISFNQYYDAKGSTVHFSISNKQYADFLIRILDAYDKNVHKFDILNIYSIEAAYQKKSNVFADSHVFIFPNGKFAQVKYDGLEEFEQFDDIEHLSLLKGKEMLTFQYRKCLLCKYSMNCIAEHLHEWSSLDECCGMMSVLDWYSIHRQKFMPYYGKLDTI